MICFWPAATLAQEFMSASLPHEMIDASLMLKELAWKKIPLAQRRWWNLYQGAATNSEPT